MVLRGFYCDVTELNRNIQSGAVTITAAANAFTEVNVTFSKTFSSMPIVVCGLKSTTSSLAYNSLAMMVDNVTTTGFKLRVSNNNSTTFAPNIQWIAINN